jgi:hypothetical protein
LQSPLPGWGVAGQYLHIIALCANIVWILFRIIDTVPIKSAIIECNADAPVKDWNKQIAGAEWFHIIGT